MKLPVFVLTFLLLFNLANLVFSQEMASDEVVKKSDLVLYGKSSEADLDIKVFRDEKVKNTMKLKAYLKGSELMICFFLYPPRNKDNAFLKNADNLWMYFSAKKKFLKIGSRQLMGGSDFSYGDILNVNLARDYQAKILDKNVVVNTHKCFKLELMAKRRGVNYDKIICYIRMNDYAPIKREFYSKSGQLFKEMLFDTFQGARPMKFVMTNKMINLNEYSVMEFSNLKLNVDVSDLIFTKEYLIREKF